MADQFGFDYLHKPAEQGSLTEWVDLTECYTTTPYSREVAMALTLMDEDRKIG